MFIKAIRRLFQPPPPPPVQSVALNDLDQAMRDRLEQEKLAEYHRHMVSMLDQRIQRLRRHAQEAGVAKFQGDPHV